MECSCGHGEEVNPFQHRPRYLFGTLGRCAEATAPDTQEQAPRSPRTLPRVSGGWGLLALKVNTCSGRVGRSSATQGRNIVLPAVRSVSGGWQRAGPRGRQGDQRLPPGGGLRGGGDGVGLEAR